MANTSIYVSHSSALHYWRTNPPWYVLEGEGRNIRALRDCPGSDDQVRDLVLSEADFGERPIDVLVPVGAPRFRSILRYHVQKAPIPPNSLYPLWNGIHVVSPTLCFVELCNTLSFAEALELGMELCGTYALRPDDLEEYATRDYKLMSTVSLCRRVRAWKDIHGLVQARKVSRYLVDGCASPMETKLYLLLCLPQKYGGYNISRPEINAKIELSEEQRLIFRQESVKPDFLWRDYNLIVEYDGEYHNDPDQIAKDAKRRVLLETMGYTVVTVKKQQVYDPLIFDEFATMIAKKTKKRVHPLTSKQQGAREELRDALLASSASDQKAAG